MVDLNKNGVEDDLEGDFEIEPLPEPTGTAVVDPDTQPLPVPAGAQAPRVASDEERAQFNNAEAVNSAQRRADSENIMADLTGDAFINDDGTPDQAGFSGASEELARRAEGAGVTPEEYAVGLFDNDVERDSFEQGIFDSALKQAKDQTTQIPVAPVERTERTGTLTGGSMDPFQLTPDPKKKVRGPAPTTVDATTTRGGQASQDQEALREALFQRDALLNQQFGQAYQEAAGATEQEVSEIQDELKDYNPEEKHLILNKALSDNRGKQDQLNRELQEVMRTNIDPNRMFAKGNGIASALAIAAGAFSQATLGPGAVNTALSIIDSAVEDDIQAQMANLNNKRNVGQLRGQLLSRINNTISLERGGVDKVRKLYYDRIAAELQKFKARASSIEAKKAAEQGIVAARRKANEADIAANQKHNKDVIKATAKGAARIAGQRAAQGNIAGRQGLNAGTGTAQQAQGIAPPVQAAPAVAAKPKRKSLPVRSKKVERPKLSSNPKTAAIEKDKRFQKARKVMGDKMTPEVWETFTKQGFTITQPHRFKAKLFSDDAVQRRNAVKKLDELEEKTSSRLDKFSGVLLIEQETKKLRRMIKKRVGSTGFVGKLSKFIDPELKQQFEKLKRIANAQFAPINKSAKEGVGGQFTDKDLAIAMAALGSLGDLDTITLEEVDNALFSADDSLGKAFNDIKAGYRTLGISWSPIDSRIAKRELKARSRSK